MVIWPLIVSALTISFDLSFLISTLCFFVIPSVLLSLLLPRLIKKVLLFSLAVSIPFTIVFDYLANYNKQWLVLDNSLPLIFGYVPTEDLIWGALFVYLVIMFYEFFSESHPVFKIWNKRMVILALSLWAIFLVFLVLLVINTELLKIPYFYFFGGLVCMVIPSLIEFIRKPKLLKKFFFTIIYFFYFTFVLELTALALNMWTFPSEHYIGWVGIFGYMLPMEEFFILFIFSSMMVLVFYESFDDDEQ